MLLLSMLSLAHAQAQSNITMPALNGQLFNPSVDAQRMLWTNDTTMAPDAYTMGRAVLHYVNDPVVYVTSDMQRTELVSGAMQLDLLAAHTRGPVRLGVDLPIYLRSWGELANGQTGLGDLRLDGRYTFVDKAEQPLGAALSARLVLPTSNIEGMSNQGFGWEVELAADADVTEKVMVAANIGTRGVPAVSLENVEWNDQFYTRLGASYGLDEDTGFALELANNFVYGEFSNPAARPMELLGSYYTHLTPDWAMRGGVGTGLNGGIGAPKMRFIVSFAYEPPREPNDLDLDGILNRHDACPTDPEDMDGVDDTDGCPDPTPVTVRVVDPKGQPIAAAVWNMGLYQGANDEVAEVPGGEYQLRVTAPEYKDSEQKIIVPDGASHEVVVTLEPAIIYGSLLVKAVDTSGETIKGASWGFQGEGADAHSAGKPVTLAIGDYSVVAQAPGYRMKTVDVTVVEDSVEEVVFELVPSRAEVTKERIDIKDSVYFETAKAVIKDESHDLLDEVADLLVNHPELTKVSIEGHTDSRGKADYNRKLSQERADAVKAYLVERGVDPSRLDATGYGEDKPLKKGNNEAAWSVNRRVDFMVTERSD